MAESQVLMIELKKYGFRFYLENNPEKSWFVNVNELKPEYFSFVEGAVVGYSPQA